MRTKPNETKDLLETLGILARTGTREVRSPITGGAIGRVTPVTTDQANEAVHNAHQAFLTWREVPAPQRGELLRLFADELRAGKESLARLVTIEAGKIITEGRGEVQEMIDICAYASGLSRRLDGLTIASERPRHMMLETWHPLGVTAVISAFNFPVAVWSWNAALALVCGDSVVWKPSPRTPLTALAAQSLLNRAIQRFGNAPPNLSTVLPGDAAVAVALANNPQVPLLSATGSTAMGRALAPQVAARLGRGLYELGGNNAAIVCPTADLDLTVRAVAFAAMGTAGQRCTTLRRLIVHESIYEALLRPLKAAYLSVTIGDPREEATLVGPLIDAAAYEAMQQALSSARETGGKVTGGERVAVGDFPDAFYARPAIVEMPSQTTLMKRETFAPILYVMKYTDFSEAIAIQNDVPQGLASSVFTRDLREAGRFLSAAGSDCGIANVNIGPSGAEIGGAFGGEKETGGGRESGSDAWKNYMRRATNTINYGDDLPLAQGVKFTI